jgi:anthranilate synthase component 1
MIQPDYKAFARLARRGNLVPVYATLRADLLTPVAAWLRLAQKAKYSFLLESVEGGERLARYTFLGCDPVEVFRYAGGVCITHRGGRTELRRRDPVALLRERMARYKPVRIPGLPPLTGGTIGYFAYDMVRITERIPATGRDDTRTDDAALMFFLGLVAFDHVRQRVWIIRNVQIPPKAGARALRAAYDAAAREIERTRRALQRPEPRTSRRRPAAAKLRITSNMSRASFLAAVRRVKRYIGAGDIFQAVLSQRFSTRLPRGADPFEIYRALREVNPSPYLFYLRMGDTSVLGASPEMLIKVQGREAFYRPIAGTRPRGRNDAEDKRLAEEMLADPKERAEHIMLVDLGRNDLGRVCEYGSVRVEDLMAVERYSHVMHLVSNLRGRLRAGVDCFDALMACFPAGTVSGAPKVRAMQIIDELEPTRRGIYAGAILYLDFSGNLDSCIAIRTLVAKDGAAHVQAGAGIVADSVPAREYDETVNKAKALLGAMQSAVKGKDSGTTDEHG